MCMLVFASTIYIRIIHHAILPPEMHDLFDFVSICAFYCSMISFYAQACVINNIFEGTVYEMMYVNDGVGARKNSNWDF